MGTRSVVRDDPMWSLPCGLATNRYCPGGDTHPLGCHRLRAQDRDCIEAHALPEDSDGAAGIAWQSPDAVCSRKPVPARDPPAAFRR